MCVYNSLRVNEHLTALLFKFHSVLQMLLEAGAHLNHTDCEGWTPLRSAAWGGHGNVVKVIRIRIMDNVFTKVISWSKFNP